MRSIVVRTALVVAAAMASTGCFVVGPQDCVTLGVFGIQVSVLDGQTSELLSGAVVTITDGDYTETPVGRGGVFAGALERAGSYTVTVDAPGYVRWTRDDINVVRTGSCGYISTAALASELTRAP